MRKLCIVLLVLCVVGCQGGHKTAKEPLKIGLVTWIGYGPFYIAQEKGFYKENGIEVVLERIEGDAERRAAIASGRLDGSCLTLDAMIVERAQGIAVRTVMAIDASIGGDGIVVDKDIQTIKDLKGQQIAFPSGMPSHFLLYSVLKDNGMSMKDIRPIIMDADKAGAAFIAKQVKVAVTWEPWLTKAKELADGHILIDSGQRPRDIEDVLWMRNEVIQTRPKDITALIEAWYEAVAFIESNPDEAKQIIGNAFGLKEADIALLLPKIRYEGKAQNIEAFGTTEKPGYLYELYDRISEAWLSEGVISKRDQPNEGIYPDLVRGMK